MDTDRRVDGDGWQAQRDSGEAVRHPWRLSHGGDCAFDGVGGAQMLPMLGGKVVERQHRRAILDQAGGRLVVFDGVGLDEGVEGAVCVVPGLGHPDFLESTLCLRVQALGQLVEHVGGLVQLTMSLPQMLADLPRACDVGTKRNAKGHTTSWIGYKLHVDTADGGIPISCIMTSASTHDSQVAIPLGTLTAGRVENLYDLMDAAYDSIEIRAHCILLGHKPIIDVNPRRSVEMQEALRREKKARRTLGLFFPEERRYVVNAG